MDREHIKDVIIESLRKHQQHLVTGLAYLPEATHMDYLEVAAAGLLREALELEDFNPFLSYHKQTPERTVWMISDDEIEIIAEDVDSFVHRAISDLMLRMSHSAFGTLEPSNIAYSLVTVMDKVLHSHRKAKAEPKEAESLPW